MLDRGEAYTEPAEVLFILRSLFFPFHAKAACSSLPSSASIPGTRCFSFLQFQMFTLFRGPSFFCLCAVLLACWSWLFKFSAVQVCCSPGACVQDPRVTLTAAEKYPCSSLTICSRVYASQDDEKSGRINSRSRLSSSEFVSFFVFAAAESISPTLQLRPALFLGGSLAAPRSFLFSLSPSPGTALKSHVLGSPRANTFSRASANVSTVHGESAAPRFVIHVLSVSLLRPVHTLGTSCVEPVHDPSEEPFTPRRRKRIPPVHQFSYSHHTTDDYSCSAPSSTVNARRPGFCVHCHLRGQNAVFLVPRTFTRARLLSSPAAKSRTHPLRDKSRIQERRTGSARTAFLAGASPWLQLPPKSFSFGTAERNSDKATVYRAAEKDFFFYGRAFFKGDGSRDTEVAGTGQGRKPSTYLEAFSCGCLPSENETAATGQILEEVRSLDGFRGSCSASGITSGWKCCTLDIRRYNAVRRASRCNDSLESTHIRRACFLKHATPRERQTTFSMCRGGSFSGSCFETGGASGKGESRGFANGAWETRCSGKSAGRRSNSRPLHGKTSSEPRYEFNISHGGVVEDTDSSTRPGIWGSTLRWDGVSCCRTPAAVSETGSLGRKTFSERCRNNGRDIGGSNGRDISSRTDEENYGGQSNTKSSAGHTTCTNSSHGHATCNNSGRDGNIHGRTTTTTRENNAGDRKSEEDVSIDRFTCDSHGRGSYGSPPVSSSPPLFYGELQQLRQSYRSGSSTTKQLLAEAWLRWKSLTGAAEVGTHARCSRRKYTEQIFTELFGKLRSVPDSLRAQLFGRAGGNSFRWTQKQQLSEWLRGVARRAAVPGSPTVKANIITSGSANGSATPAPAREKIAAAVRIAKAVMRGAVGNLVTTAAVTAKTVGIATWTTIGDPRKSCSWLLRGMLLLLPPPMPPVGQALQGVLLLSFLADTLIFKGILMERLSFDMLRETLIKDGKSGSDVKGFSSVNNSSMHRRSKASKNIFDSSFLSFCVRAAAAGLVHSNWMHLLVNLHGIRQLVPMCERLAYEAICSSKACERNGSAESYCTAVTRAAASVPTSAAPFRSWSWFWGFGAGATEATAAPTVVAPAKAAARRINCISSMLGASKGWRTCGLWLPEVSVIHGLHGREGWWARAALISLFTGGCAAGNLVSFYMRRWWRRVELSMELYHRKQEFKRKLWGGIVPETEAGNGDDDDDVFFKDTDAADTSHAATKNHHGAADAASGGAAAARGDAVLSWDEGITSEAPAAFRGKNAAAAGAHRETEAAAAAFLRAFGEKRGAGGRVGSFSRNGEARGGVEAATTFAGAAAGGKKGNVLQQRGRELVRRQEKAWERQLRLRKMRETQGKFCMDYGESTRGSSNVESSSTCERGDTGAGWKDWYRLAEEGQRRGRAGATEPQRGPLGDEERQFNEDLHEEVLDKRATITDDRRWCVRTVGCSAGLYSLLGLLFGSARVGASTKSAIVKELCKRFFTEFLVATGTDEPGHLGGFAFGYFAAYLLRW